MITIWRARIYRESATDAVYLALKRYIHDQKLQKLVVGPRIVADTLGKRHIKVQCRRTTVRELCKAPGILSWETDTTSYGGF